MSGREGARQIIADIIATGTAQVHLAVCQGCERHEWCQWCETETIPTHGVCHNCNRPVTRTTTPERIQEH